MTEEQLDVALSKVCLKFDEVHYEKLQEAYSLLEKTQVLYDFVPVKYFILLNCLFMCIFLLVAFYFFYSLLNRNKHKFT